MLPACESGRPASSDFEFGDSADARDLAACQVPVEIAEVLFQFRERLGLGQVIGELHEIPDPHAAILPVDVTRRAHDIILLLAGGSVAATSRPAVGYSGLPMPVLRPLFLCVLSVLPSLGATFGTVVAHPQSLADLALDEARKRIYLVDTYSNQVDVYSTASNPPALVTTINTSATPLAIAMSRSGKSLYVACYSDSALDIIDLTSATFSKTSVSLAANPEGVAVGSNELVLISTIGTGTGQAVLTTYNPSASGSSALQALVVEPTAPATPQMPPPNGLMYFASKSQLQAKI